MLTVPMFARFITEVDRHPAAARHPVAAPARRQGRRHRRQAAHDDGRGRVRRPTSRAETRRARTAPRRSSPGAVLVSAAARSRRRTATPAGSARPRGCAAPRRATPTGGAHRFPSRSSFARATIAENPPTHARSGFVRSLRCSAGHCASQWRAGCSALNSPTRSRNGPSAMPMTRVHRRGHLHAVEHRRLARREARRLQHVDHVHHHRAVGRHQPLLGVDARPAASPRGLAGPPAGSAAPPSGSAGRAGPRAAAFAGRRQQQLHVDAAT